MRSIASLMSCSILLVLLITGCGRNQEPPLAQSCRGGPDAVLHALAAAPRAVTLEGTSLSGCLREAGRNGDAGGLTELGSGYVEAAARLARVARRRPAATETVRLGYLIGALHSISTNAQGTSSELVRRVEDEASQVDTGAPAFVRGERAGRRSG